MIGVIVTSVYEAFSNSRQRFSEATFIHIPLEASERYSDRAIDLSYDQAGIQIEQLQQRYGEQGFGRGHRVALMLRNRAEFFLHWIALNGLGVSLVPINDEMSLAEQGYIIAHSEACLLVHLPELTSRVQQLQATLSSKLMLLASDQMSQLAIAPAVSADKKSSAQTECALLYTSGSTGKPKGCILSNEYFILSGHRYLELGGLCAMALGSERLITPLPLVHMNAMACSTMAMMLSGGCIVQLDRFHPKSWWQTVREARATIIHYLGVMPAILLELPETETSFSSQIKFAFGAGVNPKQHAVFERRFGFPLIEAWGMTETGNFGAIVANFEPRYLGTACFGRVPKHLEIRLLDETGADVALGEPGELLIRASGDRPKKGFFCGYLKEPKATAKAWEGGWLHTGDRVRQAETGVLHFVDRNKNIIRRSGENISALEVEAALSEDLAVKMAVVCAVADALRGDEVMACIMPKNPAQNSLPEAEQILLRLKSQLAYFKLPAYIAFCDELPLTASQKPKRAEVKLLAKSLLKEGNCYDLRHLKRRPREGLL